MKQYAKVEGQKIIYKGFVPKRWENISGFNGLTDEELKSYGFLPVEEDKPELVSDNGRVVFDKVFERDGKYIFEYKFVPFTESEKSQLEESKWREIRAKRNELLSATDWTQLVDTPFEGEALESIATYRQALRDVPQDFTEADDVEFPAEPEELINLRN